MKGFDPVADLFSVWTAVKPVADISFILTADQVLSLLCVLVLETKTRRLNADQRQVL